MLSINELLNVKNLQHKANGVEQKQTYGIAAEYKKQLNTSKFKLVVYFNKDKQGNYFNQYDKQLNKNRRYIPSFDFINCNGTMVQNHEVGFKKLIDYVVTNIDNISNANLILNDFINEIELTIIKFDCKNLQFSNYVNPIFKTNDKTQGVYFSHLEGEAIRVDKMLYK